MLKENGRLKPKDEKELASIGNKNYICAKCGYILKTDSAEFGRQYKCPNCNVSLEEESFI